MHGRPRSVARATLVLALSLIVAACTSTSPTTPPTTVPTSAATTPPSPATAPAADGGTLRFALGADPASIDPRFVSDEEGAFVVDALFDSLVRVADDLRRVLPAAAASWDVSDDRQTYTFHLREDGRFHDGTPVTAEAFVRSFQRIADGTADPPSFLHYQLAPVEGFDEARTAGTPLAGVRAVDEDTLEIELAHPFEEFLYVLGDASLAPVPPAAEEDPEGFAEQPIGNGPFAMASPWQHNQFIRVVTWDGYPSTPELDEVVFQIFADDAAREQQYEDFQRGQVDVAEVPASSLSEAAAQYGRSEDGYDGPGLLDGVTDTAYYYGFNLDRPVFADAENRRAFSQLIDRTRIVDEIALGARAAAASIVPPSLPGALRQPCQHCTYDAAAAVAALTDENGEVLPELDRPLQILYNSGDTNTQIAERIAADIESALGIEVEVADKELQPYVETLRDGDIDIFRLGWQADYPSPGSVLRPLFHGDHLGQDNLTGYHDAEVDALLDEARAAADLSPRLRLYADAEARILDAAPVAPIFFYRHQRLVAEDVEGFRLTPLGTVDLTTVSVERGATG